MKKFMMMCLLFFPLVPTSAKADWCLPGLACAGSGGVSRYQDYFNVYVRNASGRALTVKVEYYAEIGGWREATYEFRSGEHALLFGSQMHVIGRTIYFSAEGYNYYAERSEYDMGSEFGDYTLTFR